MASASSRTRPGVTACCDIEAPFRPRWTELKVRRALYRTDLTASSATLAARGDDDGDGPRGTRPAGAPGRPQRARPARAARPRDLGRRRRRRGGGDDARRRLVRDDGRAALRAARNQRRAPPLASAPRPRRADPERESALPPPPRDRLPARPRAERAPRSAPAERLRHGLGGVARLYAGTRGDAAAARRVPGGAALRLRPVARLLVLPADRGRRVPCLPLGDARAAPRDGVAAAPQRRPRTRGGGARDARPDAVLRPGRRARGCDRRARARARRGSWSRAPRDRPATCGRATSTRRRRGRTARTRRGRARGCRPLLDHVRDVLARGRGESVSRALRALP